MTVAVDTTLGALLISGFITTFFAGITAVQFYIYFTRFQNDDAWLRFMVIGVWMAELVTACFQCHTLYYYLITHYADPSAFETGIWSLEIIGYLQTSITVVVQCFYGSRIWKLSAGHVVGKFVAGCVILMTFTHGAFCLVFSTDITIHTRIATWSSVVGWIGIAGPTLLAVTDIVITLAMIYLLRSQTISFDMFLKNVINKLITYVVQTGAITTILAISVMATYVAMPNNMIALAILFILPQCYANSMMALLNSRARFRDTVSQGDSSQSFAPRCYVTTMQFRVKEASSASRVDMETSSSATHSSD